MGPEIGDELLCERELDEAEAWVWPSYLMMHWMLVCLTQMLVRMQMLSLE